MNLDNIQLEEFLYGYIESSGEEQKGNYKTYFIYVNTQKGKIPFKFWDCSKKDDYPKPGDFIKIKIFNLEEAASELGTYKSLSLDSLKNKSVNCDYIYINQEDVPSNILGIIYKDRSKQIAHAATVLKDSSCWKDKKHYKFLMDFIKPHIEKFSTAPAAINHHHNYKGGLFVHTSEVFSNCYVILNSPSNQFYCNDIDSDALYMSAWLHDFGKIEIYYIEKDCPKINSIKENEIGHPTISNMMFVEAAKKYELDEEFINKVSHCILSHHRRPEWGAVITPKTKEAELLCEADMISSRISN